MSARLSIGITIGTLAVMLIMSMTVIYFTKITTEEQEIVKQQSIDAKKQSEQNNRDIQYINATLTDFIKDRNIAFNKSFEYQNRILNATHSLTSDEYNKEAEKKVGNILSNMSQQHELIFKALNITKVETPNEDKQLGQLLKDFFKSQDNHKVKPNQSQGPKVK